MTRGGTAREATLIPTDQLWFHHPEMQERIRRAEEGFAAGKVTRTKTPEDAQAFLDGLKRKPRKVSSCRRRNKRRFST